MYTNNSILLINPMLLGARVVGLRFGEVTFDNSKQETIIAVTSNSHGEVIIHTSDYDNNVHKRDLAGCKVKFS
jgi:hypothetical protein